MALFALLAAPACTKQQDPNVPADSPAQTAQNDVPAAEAAAPKPAKWNVTLATGGPPQPSGGYGYRLSLAAANDPQFEAHIAALLDDTRVNDSVSLREYIDLERAGDAAKLEEIRAKGKTEGPVMFELTLYEGSTPVHQFWLHREEYSAAPVAAFKGVLQEHGQRHESSPPRDPRRPEIPGLTEPPPAE